MIGDSRGKNCPLKCADGKKEFGKIVHIQTAEGNARLEKYGQEWGLAVCRIDKIVLISDCTLYTHKKDVVRY